MWIESHVEVSDHPKTRKFARRLGVSIPTAVGHLHCLWHWAMVHAFDGNLTGYDLEDIALGAKWDGDPEDLINALVDAKGRSSEGFLERVGSELKLHDWESRTMHLRIRKEASQKANHVRWHSERNLVDPSCSFCRTPLGNPSGTTPDSTQPDQTGPTAPDLPDLTSSTPGDDGVSDASVEEPQGNGTQPLADHFVRAGFHRDDIRAVLVKIHFRNAHAESEFRIKDPVAWGTRVLRSMADCRRASEESASSGPLVIELADGSKMELVDNEWRDLVAP